MTVKLQESAANAAPTTPDWQSPTFVAGIANLPAHMVTEWEPTVGDLAEVYGTANPEELRQLGALDVDIAAAERHAATLAGAA
ncbi:hypothetical protein [Micromonospora sp. WMMD737]|uniref:hypothetical protein n=1 Tax=Micromonospora sp. WMMD737 TaxID=3404113 RepID=UPI003B94BC6B